MHSDIRLPDHNAPDPHGKGPTLFAHARHTLSRPVRAGTARAILLGAALALAVPVAAPVTAQTRDVPADFTDMVEEKLPGVVGILSTSEAPAGAQGQPRLPRGLEEFFGAPGGGGDGQPRRMQAQGSGFIISPDGYVVTNNHVVAGAEEIEVILDDGRQATAELIGTDPATDIALLKVDGMEDLPSVDWGDSETLEIGEWVVAIGNPFGLGGTVTAGIVSAMSRDINAGPYDDFLQTDAAINRGNSGGPLFDADGAVVGVNTAIFSPSGGSVGIGFAVPSAVAQTVVAELRETGRVERGWLGVRIQPVTEELADALDLDTTDGTLISDVTEGSPAAEAGLQSGDVIVGLNGDPLDTPRDLSFAVAGLDAGTEAELRILRDGEERTVSVEIGVLPTADAAEAETPEAGDGMRLGLSLAPLTPETRQQLGIAEDVEGVLVAAVENGSPAAEAGLRRGDVVVEAGGTAITGPQDLIDAVQATPEDGTLLLRLYSQGAYAYRAVPLDGGAEG